MNRAVLQRSSCPLLLALGVFVACDPTAGTRSEPDAFKEVSGTYVMHLYEGWPLPYYDFESQDQRSAGELELLASGEFILVESAAQQQIVTEGTFDVRGDSVALVRGAGRETVYHYTSGILQTKRSIFIRRGAEVPEEHRLVRYELATCDGRFPTYAEPCAESTVWSGSTIWLRGDGTYYLWEQSWGPPAQWMSRYELDGDEIVLASMPENRSRGHVRGDSLLLGGWVYVAAE